MQKQLPTRQRIRKALVMEHSECILCGTCVDNCSKKAIRYSFSAFPK